LANKVKTLCFTKAFPVAFCAIQTQSKVKQGPAAIEERINRKKVQGQMKKLSLKANGRPNKTPNKPPREP
jgi:hypothetical protein